MQAETTAPPLTDLPFLLESMKAFYIYTYGGLKKALSLYPNSFEFIDHNAGKSFVEVKEELLKAILQIEVN